MKDLKRHIVFLLSLIFFSCNGQDCNPTIQIDDNGDYLYQGVKMSPSVICKNIQDEYGTELKINLLVSQSATLESVGQLKNELVKTQLKKISYSAISSIQSDFNINGEWQVKSMVNSSIYALETNKKYLNQIVEIEHYQISHRSDLSILKNLDKTIPIANKSSELIPEEGFYNIYGFSIDKLKIKGKSVNKIKTNLNNHPLSTLLITEMDELIVGWEGLYLKLVKL